MQASHAAYEAGKFGNLENEIKSLVLCEVANERELLKAQAKLKRRGIDLVLFLEPDIGNQATALATLPLNDNQRKLMSKFKLWRN